MSWQVIMYVCWLVACMLNVACMVYIVMMDCTLVMVSIMNNALLLVRIGLIYTVLCQI